MFLLLWGSFLAVCSQLVAPLVKLLLHITCNITEYEVELRRNIKDLRKELAKISMQDEFALYAKTERKINKLSDKLKSCSSARSVQCSKASWAFKFAFHSILTMLVIGTMWSWGATPVLLLPPRWTFPLTFLISLPTGEPGGVGLPLWMALNSAMLKCLPKWSFSFSSEYRQLPLD